MFSRLKRQLAVFAPLGAGLLIITLLTALSGLWHYGQELDGQKAAKPLPGTIQLIAAQDKDKTGPAAQADGAALVTGSASSGAFGPSGPGAAPATRSEPAGKTAASSTYAKTVAAPTSIVTVSVDVNSRFEGQVKLPAGSNQCQVLSQALAEGVINSLDMRYNSQYGTYAVYVIDGIGDSSTVWWTYEVNGKSPPLGCSYTAVHNGDSVNWQYVK